MLVKISKRTDLNDSFRAPIPLMDFGRSELSSQICDWTSVMPTLRPCWFWWSMKHIWRRQWHPTPVLLPGKSHGRRSLEGCSPWSHWGSDTTERLHFHFSFSCIGEGNSNPLQCSCLENPRDGGAWWAAVYGVAQNWTRLKWLSSSSRMRWWMFNKLIIVTVSWCI